MSWWTRLLQRGRLEEELDRELRDHVERQVADHVRTGLSENDARRRARLAFGGLDQIKETCRDARGTRWLEETWQDLRFAARLLVKEPWVAAGAVLALGLGLGISSAAFTAYNGLLLRGLPVDDQHRVTALAMRDETGGEQGVSYLDFLDWRDATGSFRDIAAYSEPPMNVSDPGMGTEQFFGARVTANAFGLLGVRPVLGRDLRPDDDRPGAPPVVLLGHGIWTTRLRRGPGGARPHHPGAARLLTLGIAPLGAPFWIDFPVDGRVAAFLTLACLSIVPVSGLAPALHASSANVRDVSTGGVRSPAGGGPERRWMGWLVTAQVALTLVLLAGAGLMARSLLTLSSADRILDPAGMTAIQLTLPESRYPSAERRLAFFRALDERIAATAPGLAAARASRPPFVPAPRRELAVDGRPVAGDGPSPTVGVVTVSPDYFERLDLGLRSGRAFTDRDGTAGNETAIVNRLFAETFFADEDPLGRRIRLTPRDGPDDDAPWLTIIGVSPTVRQSFGAAPAVPVAYLPYRAEPLPFTQILARGERQATAAVGALRELDADIPLRIYTMDVVLGNTMFLPRLIGSLLAAFAWIALVLSAIGLYGVTACAATRRTQEIGVRMALGAQAGQVGWMVLRRGLAPVGIGFAAGIWGALTVGRLFESWLVETPPTDPATHLAVGALLGGVSVAACVWPARRAARLDPLVALRHE